MGKRGAVITESHQEFITRQKIFFVGTAAADGHVNVSPKGMDSLRVLSPNRVVWLNVTGSGNETAAHLLDLNRITMMFCAFDGEPLILRLYGQAQVIHPRDAQWSTLIGLFPPLPGARQLIDVTVAMVQTSCGMAVPLLDFKAERSALNVWAEKKGQDGIRKYWQEKNQLSLDDKPTEILG